MKWSWRLGRIAGIQINIHATFLLILAWVGFAHWFAEGTVTGVVMGLAFLLALFGCVLLHELGHALTAKRYGIRTRDITLLPIGGVARLERMPDDPWEELKVAVAGPAVNVVIAAVIYGVLRLFLPEQLSGGISLVESSFLVNLMIVNLLLVAFNLLPAFPMDGGRILRALLATRIPYVKATRVAAGIGQVMAILFAVLGLLANPFLIIIAVFVWFGARQEAEMAEIKSTLGGTLVEEAMLTEFQTVRPDEPVGRAIELLLAGSQHDFPVVDNGRVVGLLSRFDMMNGLNAAHSSDVPVRDLMRREFRVLEAGEPLEPAVAKLQGEECRTVPVVQFGRLVGLLTLDNVGEFIMVRSALGHSVRGHS